MDLKKYIRDIKDFPVKGIIFKDITPLLKDAEAFEHCIKQAVGKLKKIDFDYIVAAEARGFLFASAIALKMKKGIIPIRKPGKLPYKTVSQTYKLEYGKATLQMHKDALKKSDKVIVLDDVLATGGTALAMANLVKKLNAKVQAMFFVIEIDFLKGREKLSKKGYNTISLINF